MDLSQRLVIAALLVAAGCAGDLPPASRIDKLRVLAVRAEPPEVEPGTASALDALVALPPEGGADAGTPGVTWLWLACIELSTGGAPTACGVSRAGNGGPDAFGASAMGIPACAPGSSLPLCRIGDTPKVSYTPSGAALGGAATGEVIVTLIVADERAGGAIECARAAADNGGAPADPDHCVIALKRLTVSDFAQRAKETPGFAANRNPGLDGLTLGGVALGGETARFALAPAGENRPDVSVELATTRAAGSAEVKSGGKYEPLYVSWFASAGAMKEARTAFQKADCDEACARRDLDEAAATRWTPPTTDEAKVFVHGGVVDFWVVVRDDRGGVGWLAGRATEN
ncbi:MAG: hypothetical protein EXR72_24885 [Myxococcales bacterium]|nr:hypothetical protein [Myxococcales bacterium]